MTNDQLSNHGFGEGTIGRADGSHYSHRDVTREMRFKGWIVLWEADTKQIASVDNKSQAFRLGIETTGWMNQFHLYSTKS